MPRDWRSAVAPGPGGDDEQRLCARGDWCSDPRLIRNGDGTITRAPALVYRPFCDHDCALISSCLSELPGIYERLQAEIGQPAVAETSVHVPFGPSVPLRMDVDAAMRLTAVLMRSWESRVATTARLTHRDIPVHGAGSVPGAAETLGNNLGVLLALQPGWMTVSEDIPAGRRQTAAGTVPALPWLRSPRMPLGLPLTATCRHCRHRITKSAYSPRWFGTYDASADGMAECDEHEPHPATIIRPLPALIPDDIEEEFGDAEIVRFGADFVGLFVQRDGASAGLEILHLHYWNRAVLRETPARPEELLGVECRSCSLPSPALRRAEPPWHKGDPEYYSECMGCGHLMTEEEYRHWVSQLAAFHRARLAALPVLADAPVT